jgi:SAM-dependent methyltransferase
MHQEDDGRPLHAMSPTRRFADRAGDYTRFRPDYPAAAVDAVLRGLGDPARLTAADIGAGTGISSRQLADRGVRVIAIEPNAEMRSAAAPQARVEWRDGSAETTGLQTASVDLVLCAQAFHWFRPREALAEFHRILRPGGLLAVMWNQRDPADPLTRGYIEAIRAVNGEHPAERRPFDPAVIAADGWFAPAVLETFPHQQELDRAGLIGRAASASYVSKEGDAFARLCALLDGLFERHHDARGRVVMKYATQVYRAGRR